MSVLGQSESDDTSVSELKAKEFMVTGSSILLYLFQWEGGNVDLIPIHIKISVHLLSPAVLILPHPTLHLLTKYFLCVIN